MSVKYNYNNIYIPIIKIGEDNNKPEIYKLLDKYTYYSTIKPKYGVNLQQFKDEMKSKLKQTEDEIFNHIINNPMCLFERYYIFTPFIYSLYCSKFTIMGLYNIFTSLSKEIKNMFLIKPWDITTDYNFNIFHFAVLSNLKDSMRYLFRINASTNIPDINGNTALHLACILKRTSIIDTFMYYRIFDINLLNNFGESPLYICVNVNFTDGVKKLLENGASLNYVYENKIISFKNLIKKDDELQKQDRKINDDIKGLVIQNEVARKRRKSILPKLLQQSNINRAFLQQHSKLCLKMDEIVDMNLLYNLAHQVGIKEPTKLDRQVLCKRIATKMMIKSYSKNDL